jgi:hypothetical protein
MLAFLEKLTGTAAIYQFIEWLNFMIVMKYDQLSESLGDFLPHRT